VARAILPCLDFFCGRMARRVVPLPSRTPALPYPEVVWPFLYLDGVLVQILVSFWLVAIRILHQHHSNHGSTLDQPWIFLLLEAASSWFVHDPPMYLQVSVVIQRPELDFDIYTVFPPGVRRPSARSKVERRNHVCDTTATRHAPCSYGLSRARYHQPAEQMDSTARLPTSLRFVPGLARKKRKEKKRKKKRLHASSVRC